MKDLIVAASRNFQSEMINHAEYHEALVVSVDRTPIGKAYRGAFNESQLQIARGHAVQRAVVQPAEIDDGVGCAESGATYLRCRYEHR
jgi:hypothetical protein